jgi:hypothetical protein
MSSQPQARRRLQAVRTRDQPISPGRVRFRHFDRLQLTDYIHGGGNLGRQIVVDPPQPVVHFDRVQADTTPHALGGSRIAHSMPRF